MLRPRQSSWSSAPWRRLTSMGLRGCCADWIGQDHHAVGCHRQGVGRARCESLHPCPPYRADRPEQEKFARVNPGMSTSVFDANEKSWRGRGDVRDGADPVASGPSRPGAHLGFARDRRSAPCVVADLPCSHCPVLARNPRAGICGLTATPNRGDGKALREVFSGVADQITLGEMIAAGHLFRRGPS